MHNSLNFLHVDDEQSCACRLELELVGLRVDLGHCRIVGQERTEETRMPGQAKYLFIASMVVLVLADNLLLMYLGWEGVGLCSYLLIGFYYTDPKNNAAAMKAFVVTRVIYGDDVGVVHHAGEDGLMLGALEHLGFLDAVHIQAHGFESYGAADVGINGLVHDAHGAFAQFALDLVSADLFRQSQRFGPQCAAFEAG